MLRSAATALRSAYANIFQRRRMAYRAALMDARGQLSPAGRIIIAHLSKYCYAHTTTGAGAPSSEERLTREGRRQVWIEIMRLLHTDQETVLQAVKDEDSVTLG
ncbi:MAG: hypothetical protein AB7P35_17735 [Hyphomonadaceae bacterium]